MTNRSGILLELKEEEDQGMCDTPCTYNFYSSISPRAFDILKEYQCKAQFADQQCQCSLVVVQEAPQLKFLLQCAFVSYGNDDGVEGRWQIGWLRRSIWQ